MEALSNTKMYIGNVELNAITLPNDYEKLNFYHQYTNKERIIEGINGDARLFEIELIKNYFNKRMDEVAELLGIEKRVENLNEE